MDLKCPVKGLKEESSSAFEPLTGDQLGPDLLWLAPSVLHARLDSRCNEFAIRVLKQRAPFYSISAQSSAL